MSNNIQEIVNDVWGEEVYLPTDEEYPIGIVYTEHYPIMENGKKVPDGEEPWMIQAIYFSESEKDPTGNEHMTEWIEDDPLKEFIYQESYENKIMIGVTIQKGGIDSIHPEEEEKEIDGHQILYYEGPIQDQGDFVFIGLNRGEKDYGYSILHRIDEHNSEDDAIAYARKIIENK